MDENMKSVIGLTGTLVAAVFVLALVFGTFYTICAGEQAVLLTWGKLSPNSIDSGLHFKIPIAQSVYIWDIKTQTLVFDSKTGAGDNSEYSSLFAASKDLQDVQIATMVNYHVNPTRLVDMYKTFGSQAYYEKNIIEPIVRETVKTTASKYTAEELVTQREIFVADVNKILEARLPGKDAELERCSITNFQFSDVFTKSIEKKVVAAQDALAAKNKLEQIQFEAEQAIAKARGDAESMKIINNQLSQSPQYTQYLAVTKWNGNLPAVTSGMPFISIPMDKV